MVALASIFSRLKRKRILLIGDLVLDTYTYGKVERVSPEAPVPVLLAERSENRPGMAGNTALNFHALGQEVALVSRVGNDVEADQLKESLHLAGVELASLIVQEGYRTPVKNRLIAGQQQIVRVDREMKVPLSEVVEKQLITSLPTLLEEIDAVAISDYGKGVLTPKLLQALIHQCRRSEIPIVIDPKGTDFNRYSQATVIKPNASEALAASGLPEGTPIDQVAEQLLRQTQADALMITRSEEGISVFTRDGRQDFPTDVSEVRDVTGAGDTVLAVVATCLANGLSLAEAAYLSNEAAGIVVRKLGAGTATLSELAHRCLSRNRESKVSSQEHMVALKEVLKGKTFSLLGVDTQEGVSHHLVRAINRLSQDHPVVLYIKENTPEPESLHLLSALPNVTSIVVEHDNVRDLCKAIPPERIYAVKKEEVLTLKNLEKLLV